MFRFRFNTEPEPEPKLDLSLVQFSNPANMNDYNEPDNYDKPDKMDDLLNSYEVDSYNIDSASTLFILASLVTDLDSILINSSTTNETVNRAISQTYSETFS
ncbi:hypothetical protein C2G38_2204633 [Gigaspora rosea]|uniref:Uncharacterized protein n=1 Tax=Gigaspora rosea TaxID=44941 RepID=A0A397ULH7_9GLOM|nr:hypothetical protein C2G38_2204633 [Gigaspora rosea]